MKKILAVLTVVLVLSVAIGGTIYAAKPGGCQEEPPHPSCKEGPTPTPAPTPAPLDIAAFKFWYTPDPFTPTDDTITVGALDSRHTFTAVVGSFDSGRLIPGETYVISNLGSGTYVYFCSIHGINRMKGKIIVPSVPSP